MIDFVVVTSWVRVQALRTINSHSGLWTSDRKISVAYEEELVGNDIRTYRRAFHLYLPPKMEAVGSESLAGAGALRMGRLNTGHRKKKNLNHRPGLRNAGFHSGCASGHTSATQAGRPRACRWSAPSPAFRVWASCLPFHS